MIVYHYTTKDSYDEITRTGAFQPSGPWTAMDAAYGVGWYFTDLGPDNSDITISYYCWQDTSLLERTEYYLKFDVDPKILRQPREHVHMVQQWDKNLIKYLGGGKK